MSFFCRRREVSANFRWTGWHVFLRPHFFEPIIPIFLLFNPNFPGLLGI